MTGRTRKRSVTMLVDGKPLRIEVPLYDQYVNPIDMKEGAAAVVNHIGNSGKVTNAHYNSEV